MKAPIYYGDHNDDNRLELAKELGATHTINPGKENVEAAVKAIVGREGVDVDLGHAYQVYLNGAEEKALKIIIENN